MSRKILVTGASGNIGTQLAKILAEAKAEIRLMLHQSEAAKEKDLKASGAEVVFGDFNDLGSLHAAMSGIDKAYMLIPSLRNMVQLGSNFIAAAKSQNVKHIVKQSVLGADANAGVDIPKFHGIIDETLKQSGIAYTIVQPNGFMQNFLAFAPTIKDHGAFYANYADGKFSAVDVKDIANSTAAVLLNDGHENKIYAITGGAAIGAIDFAAALSKTLNKEIKYVAVPDEAAKDAMLKMGMNEWLVDNLVGFGNIFANNWAGYVSTDVETLTRKKPISVQQFADDFATFFS